MPPLRICNRQNIHQNVHSHHWGRPQYKKVIWTIISVLEGQLEWQFQTILFVFWKILESPMYPDMTSEGDYQGSWFISFATCWTRVEPRLHISNILELQSQREAFDALKLTQVWHKKHEAVNRWYFCWTATSGNIIQGQAHPTLHSSIYNFYLFLSFEFSALQARVIIWVLSGHYTRQSCKKSYVTANKLTIIICWDT